MRSRQTNKLAATQAREYKEGKIELAQQRIITKERRMIGDSRNSRA
jgi:hypothetical protein